MSRGVRKHRYPQIAQIEKIMGEVNGGETSLSWHFWKECIVIRILFRAIERRQMLFIAAFASTVLVGLAAVPMPPPNYLAVAELRIAVPEIAAPPQAPLDQSGAVFSCGGLNDFPMPPEEVATTLASDSYLAAVRSRLSPVNQNQTYTVQAIRPYGRLRITANSQSGDRAVATVGAVVEEHNSRLDDLGTVGIAKTIEFIRDQLVSIDGRLADERNTKAVKRLAMERKFMAMKLHEIEDRATTLLSDRRVSLVSRPSVRRIGVHQGAVVASWMGIALLVASTFVMILVRPHHRQQAS